MAPYFPFCSIDHLLFDRMSPGLDMSSRIETLLSLLRLEHRKFDRLQEHEIF